MNDFDRYLRDLIAHETYKSHKTWQWFANGTPRAIVRVDYGWWDFIQWKYISPTARVILYPKIVFICIFASSTLHILSALNTRGCSRRSLQFYRTTNEERRADVINSSKYARKVIRELSVPAPDLDYIRRNLCKISGQ